MSSIITESSAKLAQKLRDYAVEIRLGKPMNPERIAHLLSLCAMRIEETAAYIALLEKPEEPLH